MKNARPVHKPSCKEHIPRREGTAAHIRRASFSSRNFSIMVKNKRRKVPTPPELNFSENFAGLGRRRCNNRGNRVMSAHLSKTGSVVA